MNNQLVYSSVLDAIVIARFDYSSEELNVNGKCFRHVQSDHYDLILAENGNPIGFCLSFKTEEPVAILFRNLSGNVCKDSDRFIMPFVLERGDGFLIDEIQDFCEIFANEEGQFMIILLNVFQKDIARLANMELSI